MTIPKYSAVADAYRPRGDKRPYLRTPEEVAGLFRPLVRRSREHLIVLCLNSHAQLTASETVAVGSLNVARAAPRDVFAPAIKRDAAGIILVHNHPSGRAEPSEDDILFSRSIVRAGELLGIPCWDHVILATDGHVSLRARGVVPAVTP
jgi:DNA repair protein RadC